MAPTSSNKRKLPFDGLQRRSDGEEGTEDDGESIEDEDEENSTLAAASQVSFGALAKAQASLPSLRQRKRRHAQTEEEDDQDGARDNDDHGPRSQGSRAGFGAGGKAAPKRLPKTPRSSKHAPTEVTSKRAVTRRREVVSGAAKPAARDPRFDAATLTASAAGGGASSGAPGEERARRAYAFLDDYEDDEMARLKQASRDRRLGAEQRAELARALASMRDRRAARQRADAAREVVREHRRRERDLVARGVHKQPFYLKRSEQKRRVLVDRFAGLKKGQVDRAIERRRKKVASRERRDMPTARRGAAET
ncbi:hypothetical protein GGR56DRAFT_682248 [Xylariaceae sp. FL0804]|nr:hypothetical protein GGR56DRAFT_682248 [Xylariaceae sp. FL0804]